MKKNSLMRLAGLLLIMTLVTSCFVGGTFAKYTTSETGADSARVAKFGVTITASGTTFAETYAKTNTTAVIGANSVVATGNKTDDDEDGVDNLVAPGTSGNMASIAISGKPEVAVRVNYTADVELGNNWIDKLDKFYCPIKVVVNSTTLCGLDYESADAFEKAIEDNIAAYTKDYIPNVDLSSVGDEYIKISWEWPFEADGIYANGATQTDEKDTFLGDRAADALDNAGTISLNMTCTVTQID